MAGVRLENVGKAYGETRVLSGLDLDVAAGEFLVLVGPSGCGKSTALRLIAGLDEPTEGTISIGGRVVNGVPPRDRDIAMVFQSYALYPHMTVRENLSFGLVMRKVPRPEADARLRDAAEFLGLSPYLDRTPRQLSGGQRQRVALGRALVRRPALFLFDEPLSNLDASLRVQMRIEIARLKDAVDATMIYVTHDQVEAMTLADRIVILRSGVIEQVGTPADLYRTPRNLFVAGFIGSPAMNFLKARIATNGDGLAVVPEGGTPLKLPKPLAEAYGKYVDKDLVLGLRPEHITNAWTEQDRGALVPISLKVEIAEPLGADTLIFSKIGSQEIICRVTPEAGAMTGAKMMLQANMNHMHLFDRESGMAL
ncbi:MAG TPA: sn-glycerol-3-phosphate ABC transporter ATP-binding protein UgpC [Thermoanaerobaculia bacterium]|nr:sn-glycerol-3-phosphate ABC transporter ATP-binding protein UgpC [Thermoanaerobaculia bacterium]